MSHKKKPQKVVLTFRTSCKAQLETIAQKEDRTVSNIVGIAVQQFLDRRRNSANYTLEGKR